MSSAPDAAYYDGLAEDGGANEAPGVELVSKSALKARKRATREGRLSRPPRLELDAPPAPAPNVPPPPPPAAEEPAED